MTDQEWDEYLRRSRTWSARIGYDLLHSEAYMSLKYAPAIKVLTWFFEKVQFRVDKNKRGKKRYQMINNGEMFFTYQEAAFRGLSSNQFSKSLRELHRLSFIDVKKHGSGLLGDFTVYIFSQRWKLFGTVQFEQKEFPKSSLFGFRGKYFQRLKSNVENDYQRSESNVENGTFKEIPTFKTKRILN